MSRSNAEIACQSRVTDRLAKINARTDLTPEQAINAKRELYMAVNTTNIIENWSVQFE